MSLFDRIHDYIHRRSYEKPRMATMADYVRLQSEWYKRYLDDASCIGCGARYRDRPRNEQGKAEGLWVTEEECWTCFEKRCDTKRAASHVEGGNNDP